MNFFKGSFWKGAFFKAAFFRGEQDAEAPPLRVFCVEAMQQGRIVDKVAKGKIVQATQQGVIVDRIAKGC